MRKIILIILFIMFTSVSYAQVQLDSDSDERIDVTKGGTNAPLLTAQMTVINPDTVQSIADAIPMLAIESEWAPDGITIVDCGIKTDSSSTYTVNFEEWTAPDTFGYNLESVATSSSLEAEDDGTIGNGSGGTAGHCHAGSIIYIDLPVTDAASLQVWFTYTVD